VLEVPPVKKKMPSLEKKTGNTIISISGLTGSGKSTVAKMLAKKYGLKHLSGGDILKSFAVEAGYDPGGKDWWETDKGSEFLKKRMEDQSFDKRVDERLIRQAKRGNIVLDSWTMPWLLDEGFKVWLRASQPIRAQRTAKRDGLSVNNALEALKRKEEQTKKIYNNLYGFQLGVDFSPFHVILETDKLDINEVFHILTKVINGIY
jgi:cytidylate kinase